MTFTEAIRDAFAKYATFEGRSSRSAYWWFYLFLIIVTIAALVIDLALGSYPIIYGLATLALFLPELAVTVRRFHDAGHSGWWFLIVLVPLIGAIVALVFTLQRSQPPNKWGEGPDGRAAAAPAIA
jgi:uncharacterized membrane protein YhaH (DUF805 family)